MNLQRALALLTAVLVASFFVVNLVHIGMVSKIAVYSIFGPSFLSGFNVSDAILTMAVISFSFEVLIYIKEK